MLMTFMLGVMGIYPSISKSSLAVLTPLELAFYQLLSASLLCFIIALFTFLLNDKAFDMFLNSASSLFSKLPHIFFTSLFCYVTPIACLNYAISTLPTIAVSLLTPLVPFFTNMINRFGSAKEHISQRKMAGISFCFAGVITSLSLFVYKAYTTQKLMQTMNPLLIFAASCFILPVGHRLFGETLIDSDPLSIPFLKTFFASLQTFVLVLIFEGTSGISVLFSTALKKLITPAIAGILCIGGSLYIMTFLMPTIGFSASALVFYGSAFIAFIFGSVALKEFSMIDLSIDFSFIIGLLMQAFAMILEYMTPVLPSRREERSKSTTTKGSDQTFGESPVIPYSPFSPGEIPDVDGQME